MTVPVIVPEQELLIYQNLGSVAPSPTKLLAEDGFQALLSADVDGKAGDEILKINNTLANDRDVVTIKTYKPDLKNNMGMESTSLNKLFTYPDLDIYSLWDRNLMLGDVNGGDGKIDLVVTPVKSYYEWGIWMFWQKLLSILLNYLLLNFLLLSMNNVG